MLVRLFYVPKSNYHVLTCLNAAQSFLDLTAPPTKPGITGGQPIILPDYTPVYLLTMHLRHRLIISVSM
jgi:hypothetical protein